MGLCGSKKAKPNNVTQHITNQNVQEKNNQKNVENKKNPDNVGYHTQDLFNKNNRTDAKDSTLNFVEANLLQNRKITKKKDLPMIKEESLNKKKESSVPEEERSIHFSDFNSFDSQEVNPLEKKIEGEEKPQEIPIPGSEFTFRPKARKDLAKSSKKSPSEEENLLDIDISNFSGSDPFSSKQNPKPLFPVQNNPPEKINSDIRFNNDFRKSTKR